ncbi:hypothetical protein TNCV_4084511 [Trichonephila clavipes]|nr:hypothetical protein TNCV_4084511 [Trichonephila clavipes]
MSLKRIITSRLTGAGSLLSPVYSEAWAKEKAQGIPRTPFSSLRDAAHVAVGRTMSQTRGGAKRMRVLGVSERVAHARWDTNKFVHNWCGGML